MKKASKPSKKNLTQQFQLLFRSLLPPLRVQTSQTLPPPPPNSVPRMTEPGLSAVPSSTAAGYGTRFPDTGLESEYVVPPIGVSRPRILFRPCSIILFSFWIHKIRISCLVLGVHLVPPRLRSGPPPTDTPSTPPPPRHCRCRGGGGGSSVSGCTPYHTPFAWLGRVTLLAPTVSNHMAVPYGWGIPLRLPPLFARRFCSGASSGSIPLWGFICFPNVLPCLSIQRLPRVLVLVAGRRAVFPMPLPLFRHCTHLHLPGTLRRPKRTEWEHCSVVVRALDS